MVDEPRFSPEQIAVLGAGVVGFASGRALLECGHRVQFVDTDSHRVSELLAMGFDSSTTLRFDEPSVVVLVCVPTPVSEQSYDFDHLRHALTMVAEAAKASGGSHVCVVRSTVPPLTMDRIVAPFLETLLDGSTTVLQLAVVPEFLRQHSALEDARSPRLTVIAATSAELRERLRSLFGALKGPVLTTEKYANAELIKIAHNALNATKISFFNEIHQVSMAVGADEELVASTIVDTAEAMWNPLYGTRGGTAFGGRCLPKDLEGLVAACGQLLVATPLLEAVMKVNNSMPSPEHQ